MSEAPDEFLLSHMSPSKHPFEAPRTRILLARHQWENDWHVQQIGKPHHGLMDPLMLKSATHVKGGVRCGLQAGSGRTDPLSQVPLPASDGNPHHSLTAIVGGGGGTSAIPSPSSFLEWPQQQQQQAQPTKGGGGGGATRSSLGSPAPVVQVGGVDRVAHVMHGSGYTPSLLVPRIEAEEPARHGVKRKDSITPSLNMVPRNAQGGLAAPPESFWGFKGLGDASFDRAEGMRHCTWDDCRGRVAPHRLIPLHKMRAESCCA